MAEQISLLTFNRGLDEVVRSGKPAAALPRGAQIAPGARMMPSPVAEAVVPRSLDELIADYFEPQIGDTSVLIPAKFKRMAATVATALLRKARASPHNRAKLMDASDVLTRFSADLMDLERRRGALIRG